MPNKKKNNDVKAPRNQRGKRKSKSAQKPSKQDHFLRNKILSFLRAHRDKPYSVKQIAGTQGLHLEAGNNKLRSVLDQLTHEGKLSYVEKGRYQYLSSAPTLTGNIQVTRSGVGFLLMEEEEDIFIGSDKMGKAMDGDLVKVKLLNRRSKRGRKEGEVMEVVERSRTQFVGIVEESMKDSFFLLPDSQRIPFDFYIPKKYLNGAKDGQKVLAELVSWEKRSPEVKVLTVLGEAGEHETEMHAILLQFGFDPNFPTQVEQEVAKIPDQIPGKEIKKRRDMRDVPTFTIDPDDAKDFDDALSVRKLENGRHEIGVHIADVSYYVRPGTELDKEAFHRATSVYLVDRTVPMLPERLSNGLCSLRPNEDKLTYSAVFEIDDEGKVHKYWIGQTVTHSDHRFAYEDAQAILEFKSEGPMREELHLLDRLAKLLRAKRMGTGAIEFETTEVKFVLDDNGKPLGVVKKESKDANKLIEDFMLLANRTVAKHIHDLFKDPPLPSIYRIHDLPDGEKLSNLGMLAKHFGYSINFEEMGETANQLNRLLRHVQGKPEQNVIETVAIRSMAKAIYSTNNIGHFGLGFPFYTHFTSPIRRYPDLMIHRLLSAYGNKEYRENPTVLEAQAKHCSAKERTAAEAERASIKYKQVEFMRDKIGAEFTGVISGVIEAGMFVELEENLCEGMAPVRTLEDDYYVFDETKYEFTGKDRGQTFRLGDRVKVEITDTDLKRRTIDMRIVEKLPPLAEE